MTTQTEFRKAPSKFTKIELSVSPQGVTYRRRGKPIVLSPLNDKAKAPGFKTCNTTSTPDCLAIQPSAAPIAGAAGTKPSSIWSVQTAAVIGLSGSTPEATSPVPTLNEGNASPSASASAAPTAEAVAKPPKPRSKRKKTASGDLSVPIERLKYLTIAQTALRYPAFSEKALRHLQAQAESYQRFPKAGLRSNGFINCIVRPAGQRKVIIAADKFELWLSSFSTQ